MVQWVHLHFIRLTLVFSRAVSSAQKQKAQEEEEAQDSTGVSAGEGGRDRSDSGVARGARCGPGLYAQGTYALEEEIGRGGFARVYRARNADTGEAVAAKVCPFKKTKPEAVQREVEMMLMLRHPSIVRLWDVVLENAQNRVVLIEELVTGGDMFDLVSQQGGLAEPVALHYFAQIIAGVAYCHSKGVCHRDLKLENLLLDAVSAAHCLQHPPCCLYN